MKIMKNSLGLVEKNFKPYNSLWRRKLIKPSFIYPPRLSQFDILIYIATIIENQNKPQTAENGNYLNHLETSPFRPVNCSKNKLY